MNRKLATCVILVAAASAGAQAQAQDAPQPGTATADDPAVQPAPQPGSPAPGDAGDTRETAPAAERDDTDPAASQATSEAAPAPGPDEAPAQPDAGSEAAPVSAGPPADASVMRAQFTSAIVEREPVDEVVVMPNDVEQIYYFTELRNLEGRTVTHIWRLDGERMAEVSFDVGGPRWRVWSKKSLAPGWTGQWTVSVVDESGEVLTEDGFNLSDDVLKVPQ